MGLARVGGMCTVQHNCVIGVSISISIFVNLVSCHLLLSQEIGVTNSRGKPYPSAGFTR